MDSVETEEGWLTTPDGHKLYTKTWKPEGPLKARVVFLHGIDQLGIYSKQAIRLHCDIKQASRTIATGIRSFSLLLLKLV